jgi:acetyl-CoA C-acetyltransferase
MTDASASGIPEAFIYEAIRTPRGKGKPGGSLHTVKPVDLLSGLITEVLERNPELDPGAIEDILTGVVTPLGDQGMDIARTAALNAGLPYSVTGVQLNRYCASGLTSVNYGAMKIRSGFDDLVLAGGVESMSRVPMGSDGGALAMDPETSFYNDFIPQGVSADLIATLDGVSRDELDAYASRSHERAAKAWEEGRFANSVVPVKDNNGLTVLDRDETIRPGTTPEKLAGLRPAFAMVGDQGGFDAVALNKYPQVEAINHVHHGGNSSGIVDGASLLLIGNEAAGQKNGLTPRARVVTAATTGVEPTIMLTAPAPAARAALARPV